MQYATTRNDQTKYSYLYALNDDRALDGGLYVPAEMPVFTPEQIAGFAMKNANQAVAELLNLMFDQELTRWDVDFAVGRYPVRLSALGRNIAIAESWHNPDWDFSAMVTGLAALVRGSRDTSLQVGSWAGVAVRIGVFFGVFGELMREGIAGDGKIVDLAIPSGDLSAVAAARFAREMGLPIGNIVICCNENDNLWHLIKYGEMRTGNPLQHTSTPDCDHIIAPGLEWLIHSCGGAAETARFVQCCADAKAFFPEDETLKNLQQGMYVSVVGRNRVESTVYNVYKDQKYVFGPYSALTHAGLMDYRAKTGTGRFALLLSERGALCDDGFVARYLGIAVSTLHKIL